MPDQKPRQTTTKLPSLFWVCLCCLLCWAACTPRKTSYRMAAGASSQSIRQLGQDVIELWQQQTQLQFEMVDGSNGSVDNIRLLLGGQAHFAMARYEVTDRLAYGADSNAIQHLRTVALLNPSVFFVLYKANIQASSLPQLVQGRSVNIGLPGSGTAAFSRKVFAWVGVDSARVRWQHGPDPEGDIRTQLPRLPDVYCFTKLVQSKTIADMLHNGYALWSLDDARLLGSGSAAEGFCLFNPTARPYVIPRYSYGQLPAQPVLTLALETEILTHADTDPLLVYDLVKALYSHKELLAMRNPAFAGLSTDITRQSLSVPLHRGTLMYLERDKPGLVERNADVIGLSITLLTLLYGGFIALRQRLRARQKSRIDVFYLQVVTLEKSIDSLQTEADHTQLLRQLRLLREEACQQLANERLNADESFSILLGLIDQAVDVVVRRRDRLSGASA